MDNAKMGAMIREARKKKGLTQKDIATHLNITDRAVSKWERGICAPDLALLEPLADILEISITELITGEMEPIDEHKEELEHVVKETIQYSKQETTRKNKTQNKQIILGILLIILSLFVVIGIMWYKGFFHKIGKYSSPDGSVVTTIYNCQLGYHEPPSGNGVTLRNEGLYSGEIVYQNCEFRGLWWSMDNNYQVVSLFTNKYNENWLWITDFKRNTSSNLVNRLEEAIYRKVFFSKVEYDKEGYHPQIKFEFVQWNSVDPSVMLIYFSYRDVYDVFHEGYMWYDYESGEFFGEMEINQGEKEIYWENEIWDNLN
ncbi:MAG: helix-turn-helix transcriptional regulator [Agathobacter sp.]|nr:helix-turn-helix transcriptional regulator [Agathobacter sp.]